MLLTSVFKNFLNCYFKIKYKKYTMKLDFLKNENDLKNDFCWLKRLLFRFRWSCKFCGYQLRSLRFFRWNPFYRILGFGWWFSFRCGRSNCSSCGGFGWRNFLFGFNSHFNFGYGGGSFFTFCRWRFEERKKYKLENFILIKPLTKPSKRIPWQMPNECQLFSAHICKK